MFCDITDFKTESDVEQKFLWPLLTEALGYSPAEILTKDYLAPTTIDKGAGKKIGYYPDYVVRIGNLPVIVAEAKAPQVDAAEGFREARLYANELNARFPPQINPVRFVLACNGTTLLWGVCDSAESESLAFSDFSPVGSQYLSFRAELRKLTLSEYAAELQRRLRPVDRVSPITFVGGNPIQNSELPPNEFAKELVPLIKAYFDPDRSRTPPSVVARAYCATDGITKYNELLESLLKDNIAKKKFPAAKSLSTTKKEAKALSNALKIAVESPDTTLMLIGGVGAGKSIFIDRYYSHLMDDHVRQESVWCFVDFNNAPDSLAGLETWIASEVLKDFPLRNDINAEEFDAHESLLRYFAPDIAKLRRGPFAKLTEAECENRIADELYKWTNDPLKFSSSLLRYHGGDRGKAIIVVFDNVDKRDRDQQLRVFQQVQYFREQHRCTVILSLRDETYDAFRNHPPLDAFLKPFIFRIQPPRFLDVAAKRLDLIIEELTAKAPSTNEFSLPNGIRVKYPNTRLGLFLRGVYAALFAPRRKLRLVLEALAGKNVRRALEMFAEILMSGHLTGDKVFSTSFKRGEVSIPEHLALRILMRTKYRYFRNGRGYIYNVFSVDPESPTTSNFLVIELLGDLSRNRKVQGDLGIQGYQSVQQIVARISALGYRPEDVLWALQSTLQFGLVTADNQRSDKLEDDGYVRISASGHFHLHFLTKRFEYVAGVALDTAITDYTVAKRIGHLARSGAHTKSRLRSRIEAAELFCTEMREELSRTEGLPVLQNADLGVSKDVVESVTEAVAYVQSEEPKQEGLFRRGR